MSTILKALRRLEEDSSIEATQSVESSATTAGLDPSNRNTSADLRTRILAAEATSETENEDDITAAPNRAPLIIALAAALIVGIGLGIYRFAPDWSSESSATNEPTNIAARASAPPADTRPPARPASPAEASRTLAAAPTVDPVPATEPPDEPPIALAAVAPTPAVLAAQAEEKRDVVRARARAADTERSASSRSARRPQPTPAEQLPSVMRARVSADPPRAKAKPPAPAEPAPIPVRDEAPVQVAEHKPSRSESRSIANESPSANTSGLARPAQESAPAPVPAPANDVDDLGVEEHAARPIPDVAVLRTAWHPSPDRRSTKIRLIDSGEVLTLQEGDAVGGLVIQTITPSAVLFQSGDVELRLRVGQPGSSR